MSFKLKKILEWYQFIFDRLYFGDGKGEFKQTDPSLKSRDGRKPIYGALYGLGCVSSSWIVRSGKMVGGKVGILPVENVKYSLRIKDFGSEKIYNAFLENETSDIGYNAQNAEYVNMIEAGNFVFSFSLFLFFPCTHIHMHKIRV